MKHYEEINQGYAQRKMDQFNIVFILIAILVIGVIFY
jgi:hypothetical protein